MIKTTERVGELIEGARRRRRELISPEGVPLDIRIAGHGERAVALFIDFGIMTGIVLGLYLFGIALFFSRAESSVGMTLIQFLAFAVRNLYFLHFELAWQGRTPGKKACHLRVINRKGGELTPSAVIARNLMREIELFLPLGLLLTLDVSFGVWMQAALLGWVALVASLPLWNAEHLRAGDIISGTQVIAMPRRILLEDLTVEKERRAAAGYSFTPGQLAVYGAFELQVLEELLRRPASRESDALLNEVCVKICRKIGWTDPVPYGETRRFLADFYEAERADLERGKLFGRMREDKTSAGGG